MVWGAVFLVVVGRLGGGSSGGFPAGTEGGDDTGLRWSYDAEAPFGGRVTSVTLAGTVQR